MKTDGKETFLLKACVYHSTVMQEPFIFTGPHASNALDNHLSVCILINGLRVSMHALFLSLLRGVSPEQVWAKIRISLLTGLLSIHTVF